MQSVDGDLRKIEGESKKTHKRINLSPFILGILVSILTLGVGLNAFGFLGFGGDSWKEEVLQHDGSRIIVQRSQSYGGRHEIGQSPPIKEHTISFKLPSSNKTITWTSEYGEDIGRANFNLLAVHVLNNTPYIVASPNLCLSYNKWGRPNPPYVFFKYDGKAWQRIPLEKFPFELKTINVVIYLGGRDVEKMVKLGLVPAEKIHELNREMKQPEYQTILREPLVKKRINDICEERIFYKGSWILPNDPIAKKFIDLHTK